MTVTHILVPYDGRIHSDKAFDEALNLSKKYSCSLSIITCFHESLVRMFGMTDFLSNKNTISNKLKILNEKAKKAKIKSMHYVIDSRNVVYEILSFSNKNNVDMIIMGSENHGGLKKIIYGSIANEVQKNAKCIVKVII